MRLLQIVLLTIIMGGVIQAQTLNFNHTFTKSETLPLATKNSEFTNNLTLKGSTSLDSPESLIRIVLNGSKGEKILLFEAFYPLYLPVNKYILNRQTKLCL